MNTIPQILETVARENRDQTAIVDRGSSFSYASLERRVASFASELNTRGVRPGARVALLLPNSLDFVAGYLGTLTLGAIVVLLNHHYQQNELRYFLAESGASLLVTSKDFTSVCEKALEGSGLSCQTLFSEDVCAPSRSSLALPGAINDSVAPDVPAMYQFSSGSTGTPKQIVRTHRNLVFELNGLVSMLQLSGRDRVLGVAPFSHVNGLMRSMLASLRAGATLYPVARFDRHAVAELIEKDRLTVFIAVPFMFAMLAKTNFRQRPDFSSLRLCISASAPMPKTLNQEFYEAFGIHVRQLYGSTETGTISVNLGPDIEGSLESVGTPLPGIEVEVFTDKGGIAKVGEVGEFAVRSPSAIEGYVGSDEVNKKAFRNGYFFTDDLGKRDEAGRLYLTGRKKFFINKGGYKIDPREIEELLEGHPKVDEVVVLGVPTSYGDEKVKAVIVPKISCTEEEIVAYCRGKIADFKVPSLVEFRDDLPKSAAGKILRQKLL